MVRAEYGTWNNYGKEEHDLGNVMVKLLYSSDIQENGLIAP